MVQVQAQGFTDLCLNYAIIAAKCIIDGTLVTKLLITKWGLLLVGKITGSGLLNY
jgi:hypothetical protein